MTHCSVIIQDNIIMVSLEKDVTFEDARNIAIEAVPLMKRHKDILHGGFIDLTKAANADTMARKELASSLKKCSGFLKKVAVFAPDIKRRVVAKIVLAMGGWKDYKMFSDRDKAIAWLKE